MVITVIIKMDLEVLDSNLNATKITKILTTPTVTKLKLKDVLHISNTVSTLKSDKIYFTLGLLFCCQKKSNSQIRNLTCCTVPTRCHLRK